MRLRLDLSYDGTGFHGWARQPGLRTVQGELEQALDTVLRTTGSTLTVAGRTDTGVHARGQVAHLDVDPALVQAASGRSQDPPEEVLVRRLNGVLDPDLRVRGCGPVAPGFDARFSASWRRYAYRVADRPDLVDPLTRSHVLAWPRPLDVELLNRGAELLLGEHDFAAFCRRREGATTIRTLLALEWERPARGPLVATVRADAFCHSMVRALVGCLLPVGEGRRPVTWPGEVLARRQRDPAVTVAHAHGLTLEEVAYPAADQLARRAEESRTLRTLPGG
ncbi:tRNA pseudouridine38-40 synthase [Nocardioides scoriae]|uniref:tRNA pseudouridine synthase A n=1 Tax=Nocardioides scoriae TaxID=642780 RepID=A0A1H1T642_9ACTN|nr:tRNA pseudouridine(38-40) synthase TruA [Nocardioides scoriae]SDS55677.1 tRNA pseudouridine38-40 synthase [Nocardioides scoriae]